MLFRNPPSVLAAAWAIAVLSSACSEDSSPGENSAGRDAGPNPGALPGSLGGAPSQPEPGAGDAASPPMSTYRGPTADNPIVACETAVAFGEDPLIDDFEDLDQAILTTDQRAAEWYEYDDELSNATQSLTFENSKTRGGGVLRVKGGPFVEYSGIGTGLRWTVTGSEHCAYDASYYDGVRFWAKGTSDVRVALQNPSVRPMALGGACPENAGCFDSHGFDIVLTEDWQLIQLAFDDAAQAGWGTSVGVFDPAQIYIFEFQFPAHTSYELSLDDVAFYRNGNDTNPDDAGMSQLTDAGDAGPDGGTTGRDGGTTGRDGGTTGRDGGE